MRRHAAASRSRLGYSKEEVSVSGFPSVELGFSEPGASKNFSRKIQIESQRDLAFVARLAFRVLRGVYGVSDFGSARFTIAPARA
jgi:hypothetical protein